MPIEYQSMNEELKIWKRDRAHAFHQHLHKYIEVMYIKKGHLLCSVDFTEYELCSGDTLFLFPDKIHSHENSSSDAEIYVMIFGSDDTVLKNIFENKMLASPVIRGIALEEIDILWEKIWQEYCIKNTYSLAAARGFATVLVSRLLSCAKLIDYDGSTESIEERLIKFCNEHYRENITLNSLAEALGYNPSYLSHIFSQKFKSSFLKFINNMRVDDAKKRLRGDEKITQIALNCGFGSIRNFNRVFKNFTGKTPKEYRNIKKK